jgi:hypothetical protein
MTIEQVETRPETIEFTPPKRGEIPVRPASWVIGLFGKRGSGKSIVMCYFGLDAYQHGEPVFYYPPEYGFAYGTPLTMAELVQVPDKLKGATILIDEMQEVLSKYRTGSAASLRIMAFIRQVRKIGATVVFTSNSPEEINRSLASQADYHANCTFYQDHRCDKRENHLKTCEDLVVVEWVDTQGASGINPYKKDGRKRYPAMLKNVQCFYGLYRTESIADVNEVLQLTAAKIVASVAEERLGMRWGEFDDLLLDEIVPSLVLGDPEVDPPVPPVAQLVPGPFARLLMRERGIDIDATKLGEALKRVGLYRGRTKTNNYYHLPRADQLADWRDGLWLGPGQ